MAAWSPIPLGSPLISTGWSQVVLGNLRSIGIVEVRGELLDKVVTATRFYLTSLPADTALFAQVLREHWHIENRLHWILDTLFREDESRMRKTQGPQNFAVLRSIALNLFQRQSHHKRGIKARWKRVGWERQYLPQGLMG